jgi:hypothetical protein
MSRRLVLAFVAFAFTVSPALAQKRAVTIDDIFAIKAVGSPVVSPDGTQVVYTVRQW